MKYREKVNKNVKKNNVNFGSCCHGNNKYTTIILLHSSASFTIIHPIIILTFNFDMLELFYIRFIMVLLRLYLPAF